MTHPKLNLDTFECQGSPVIDLTKPPFKKGKEGCGVWLHNEKEVWKIFSNTDRMEKLKKAYELARENDLPMPEYRFVEGYVTCRDRPKRGAFALVTALSSGAFFAFDQKSCGQKAFLRQINSITDDNILYRIECGLVAAKKTKLNDPQGFFEPTTHDYPLMFIDIHIGSHVSGSITKMHDAVLKRRRQLSIQ